MRADRHFPFDAGDLLAEPLRQPHSAALETDEDHAVETPVALDDLVRHADRRPPHVVAAEHLFGRPCGPLGRLVH